MGLKKMRAGMVLVGAASSVVCSNAVLADVEAIPADYRVRISVPVQTAVYGDGYNWDELFYTPELAPNFGFAPRLGDVNVEQSLYFPFVGQDAVVEFSGALLVQPPFYGDFDIWLGEHGRREDSSYFETRVQQDALFAAVFGIPELRTEIEWQDLDGSQASRLAEVAGLYSQQRFQHPFLDETGAWMHLAGQMDFVLLAHADLDRDGQADAEQIRLGDEDCDMDGIPDRALHLGYAPRSMPIETVTEEMVGELFGNGDQGYRAYEELVEQGIGVIDSRLVDFDDDGDLDIVSMSLVSDRDVYDLFHTILIALHVNPGNGVFAGPSKELWRQELSEPKQWHADGGALPRVYVRDVNGDGVYEILAVLPSGDGDRDSSLVLLEQAATGKYELAQVLRQLNDYQTHFGPLGFVDILGNGLEAIVPGVALGDQARYFLQFSPEPVFFWEAAAPVSRFFDYQDTQLHLDMNDDGVLDWVSTLWWEPGPTGDRTDYHIPVEGGEYLGFIINRHDQVITRSGDFNGDGLPDLFYQPWGQDMLALMNRGSWYDEGDDVLRLNPMGLATLPGSESYVNTDVMMWANTTIADIDADGDDDVVGFTSVAYKPNVLAWWEATQAPNGRVQFVRHIIGPGYDWHRYRYSRPHNPVDVGDVDGDGQMEVLVLDRWFELNQPHDCNQNGVPDSCELLQGHETDANQNGVLDRCEPFGPVCLTDINGQWPIDIYDINILNRDLEYGSEPWRYDFAPPLSTYDFFDFAHTVNQMMECVEWEELY